MFGRGTGLPPTSSSLEGPFQRFGYPGPAFSVLVSQALFVNHWSVARLAESPIKEKSYFRFARNPLRTQKSESLVRTVR
jgi:hypothetical protein